MNKPKIILVLGESGCGKSTLIEEMEWYGYKAIQSYTTRPKRTENEKGHIFVRERDYDFIQDNKTNEVRIYDKLGNEVHTIAYTYFNGNHYWATMDQVKESVYYIVDKAGADYFAGKVGNKIDYKIVYITVPFLTRVKRLSKRDGLSKGVSRLLNDFKMFRNLKYDTKIVNRDLEQSVQELRKITSGFMNMKE
ncbi:guanylate kinase [Clostridium botulinum D/C]|uniref:guanylate kinase n=1 Tax=Clostridium botulinum TaxID=1491 RepID=UPI001E2A24CB|nr:guanylate kinase [Clostridium botulinum]MCD3321623.1 guanylate kinase [Clostridium botulinum D/C]MCD3324912.1 guanylate kinase [Clostridium botulinum D/C]MCD3328317.1 guanylate kinase [Clostridium botulinum D/C]